MEKPSFRARMLREREDAIVLAVKQLLAEKGFEAMTLDEVAARVGIAKASLYKHFSSKEALAAAAMVRLMDRALDFVAEREALVPPPAPLEQLKAVARWSMELQLAGEMPSLPAQNSSLRAELTGCRDYLDRLFELSDRLGVWIEAAQAAGTLNPALPPEVVLYTVYARACDPVLGVLRQAGSASSAQIIDWVLSSCFDGLAAR